MQFKIISNSLFHTHEMVMIQENFKEILKKYSQKEFDNNTKDNEVINFLENELQKHNLNYSDIGKIIDPSIWEMLFEVQPGAAVFKFILEHHADIYMKINKNVDVIDYALHKIFENHIIATKREMEILTEIVRNDIINRQKLKEIFHPPFILTQCVHLASYLKNKTVCEQVLASIPSVQHIDLLLEAINKVKITSYPSEIDQIESLLKTYKIKLQTMENQNVSFEKVNTLKNKIVSQLKQEHISRKEKKGLEKSDNDLIELINKELKDIDENTCKWIVDTDILFQLVTLNINPNLLDFLLKRSISLNESNGDVSLLEMIVDLFSQQKLSSTIFLSYYKILIKNHGSIDKLPIEKQQLIVLELFFETPSLLTLKQLKQFQFTINECCQLLSHFKKIKLDQYAPEMKELLDYLNQLKEKTNLEQVDIILFAGPDERGDNWIQTNVETFKKDCTHHELSYSILHHSMNNIPKEILSFLPKTQNIVILAHGNTINNIHTIRLFDYQDQTLAILQEIQKQTICEDQTTSQNIILNSCLSGQVIKEIQNKKNTLNPDTNVLAFSAKNESSSMIFTNKIFDLILKNFDKKTKKLHIISLIQDYSESIPQSAYFINLPTNPNQRPQSLSLKITDKALSEIYFNYELFNAFQLSKLKRYMQYLLFHNPQSNLIKQKIDLVQDNEENFELRQQNKTYQENKLYYQQFEMIEYLKHGHHNVIDKILNGLRIYKSNVTSVETAQSTLSVYIDLLLFAYKVKNDAIQPSQHVISTLLANGASLYTLNTKSAPLGNIRHTVNLPKIINILHTVNQPEMINILHTVINSQNMPLIKMIINTNQQDKNGFFPLDYLLYNSPILSDKNHSFYNLAHQCITEGHALFSVNTPHGKEAIWTLAKEYITSGNYNRLEELLKKYSHFLLNQPNKTLFTENLFIKEKIEKVYMNTQTLHDINHLIHILVAYGENIYSTFLSPKTMHPQMLIDYIIQSPYGNFTTILLMCTANQIDANGYSVLDHVVMNANYVDAVRIINFIINFNSQIKLNPKNVYQLIQFCNYDFHYTKENLWPKIMSHSILFDQVLQQIHPDQSIELFLTALFNQKSDLVNHLIYKGISIDMVITTANDPCVLNTILDLADKNSRIVLFLNAIQKGNSTFANYLTEFWDIDPKIALNKAQEWGWKNIHGLFNDLEYRIKKDQLSSTQLPHLSANMNTLFYEKSTQSLDGNSSKETQLDTQFF
ncbi:MAG: hypothetical protein HYX60_07630 [Legionella longbeachae]|nr:hypothetical protein [Legionella longbeachae]